MKPLNAKIFLIAFSIFGIIASFYFIGFRLDKLLVFSYSIPAVLAGLLLSIAENPSVDSGFAEIDVNDGV